MRSPDALTARRAALAAALVVGLAACGSGDSAGDPERFCGEIEVHRTQLVDPDLAYADDIEPLLALYRRIGDYAPLAIEAEWDQLIVNYETASTVVPGDDDSLQRVVASAYQSEQAAAAVNDWLVSNCALDLGPLSTIVAHDG